MSQIVVRPMCEDDLGIVSDLAMLANPHAEKEKYHEHIADELRRDPDLSFVATDRTKVVGYVQGDIRGTIAILEDLAVDRKYQNRRIGAQLLNAELEALKKKGSKIVISEVHHKNAKAIPFYYRHVSDSVVVHKTFSESATMQSY